MGVSMVRVNGIIAVIATIALAAASGCSSGTSVIKNPTAPAAPLALADIFVIQGTAQAGSSVMRFQATSPGNATPVSTATPAVAANIVSVAIDTTGSLYAGVSIGEILVFPATTQGTITPTQTIVGGSSFTYPYQITVDAGGGLYVLDNINKCVAVYSTAAGQTTPIRTIVGAATQINDPVAIAVDSAGNIYVANRTGLYPTAASPQGAQVEVFGPGVTGNIAPAQIITGTATAPFSPILGLALDPSSNLYLNFGPKIAQYTPSSAGVFSPAKTILPPAAQVQSSTLQFDTNGNMFVLWLTEALAPNIAVYPKSATGFEVPESPYTTSVWTGTPAGGQFALQ